MDNQKECPIILASASRSRAAMLVASGLTIKIEPADINEARVKDVCLSEGRNVDYVAALLARKKAKLISRRNKEAFVIGADQMLDCGGTWFDKPIDLASAEKTLKAIRGRCHDLVTSVSVVQNEKELWQKTDRATLQVREFSDFFIERYLQNVGELALTSVGAYQLEGPGAQLFERIEGDYFTILGLPLLPLLSFLRTQNLILS